ncbi:hypothetical protein ACHAXT_003712 [Thalassiosira profunda]
MNRFLEEMSGDSGADEAFDDGDWDTVDGEDNYDWEAIFRLPVFGRMNAFRISGDLCHFVALIILLRRLQKAKNAQGISLRTQELYLLVSVTRYTDLLTTFYSFYNSFAKLFFIAVHSIMVYMIRWNAVISASYDRVQDNFPSWKCLVLPGGVLAALTHLISGEWSGVDLLMNVQELLWMFSMYLESVAILPQLSLLRRYRVIENLTGNYVFFMGLYRALYIANWIYRAYYEPGYRHHYVVYACGILQTALFTEFFYHWLVSKMRGGELRYGDEGDIEYDCDVNEMRTYENSTALLENSDIRTRGSSSGDAQPEEEDLLVV